MFDPRPRSGIPAVRRNTAKAADAGAKLGDFQKAEEAAARMRDMGFASPEVPDREEPAAETEEASDESRR